LHEVPLAAALTIGGLDPSGGAGIAADLRAFAEAGVWGCAVCAALTVQSTRGVRAVEAIATSTVRAQARELLSDIRVRAIKTGALGSAANARAIARLLARPAAAPAIVDPVMLPTRRIGRNARLYGGSILAMRELACAATLVTPNFDEAGALLGELVTEKTAADAARELVRRGSAAVLVKGGHGRGREAVDWLATPRRVVRLAHRRRPGLDVHGTGCVLASLIAGRLVALGAGRLVDDATLVEVVTWSRARLDAALARPLLLGQGLPVLFLSGELSGDSQKARRKTRRARAKSG
jgi:hydroxymethylpyrimidine/phosphomethylpyrimidine kinase